MAGSRFTISEKIEYLQIVEEAYGVYSGFSIYYKNGIKIGDTHNLSLGADYSKEPAFVNAMKGHTYYDIIPVFQMTLVNV